MRIGSGYNYLITEYNSRRNQKFYSDALTPLSTGKRINYLSDDPTHITEYFQITQELKQIESHINNISLARSQVNMTDTVLEQMNSLLQEAYELSLQGNDQTLTSDDLSNISTRFTDIRTDFLRLANTKINGKYIFSGFETATQPFSGTPVVYSGDANRPIVKISDNKFVYTGINGNTSFGPGATVDGFDALSDMLTAILARDKTTIGTNITRLQNVMNQLSTARGDLANTSKVLDSEEDFLGKQKIQLSERFSHIADVDIAEASTELSFREYTLQASMALARKIFELQNSSFDI